MTRLLYDHEFFSAYPYSGITRYFSEIIRRIGRNPDFGVSLFMGFHVNEYGLEKERHRFKSFFGMRRPRIPKTARLFNAMNDALFPFFARRSGADILHQTYYSDIFPDFKGKRIVNVYDMSYELLPDMFPVGFRAVSDKRKSMERADGIIAISESTRRDLIDLWKVPEEKIKTIHLGNSLTLDPGPAQLVKEPYILYVGQRVPHKNFGALLKAYGRTRRIHEAFRLVCFGGSPLSLEEHEEARSLGVEGRISQMTGPDTMLANLYGHASALAYPSFYEGFGLPIVEAMGYGCPVVASRTSSLPEVAGAAALYFDPKEPGELALRLEKALYDAETTRILSAAGRERSRLFTWDACAERTMAYYGELLDR
ncbi:MAG: glycosyltransferase family 4 protein [Fibrobacterota bacterium]|nr:glycosyltransferase family 4 protein [Fibrobacterota bacterium]